MLDENNTITVTDTQYLETLAFLSRHNSVVNPKSLYIDGLVWGASRLRLSNSDNLLLFEIGFNYRNVDLFPDQDFDFSVSGKAAGFLVQNDDYGDMTDLIVLDGVTDILVDCTVLTRSTLQWVDFMAMRERILENGAKR